MGASAVLLEIRDLARPGLEPASLKLARGECVALSGPSGAGKSLLLRAISDLDPNTGEVRLEGTLRESMPAPDWRRQVCYLAAEPGWWSERVSDHYADWSQAARIAERLGLASDYGSRMVANLSTGERQRLALVRALSVEPSVLLLDEPTSGLDPEARDRAEALLEESRRADVGLIWVTHDQAQAKRVAKRQFTMSAGRLQECSP